MRSYLVLSCRFASSCTDLVGADLSIRDLWTAHTESWEFESLAKCFRCVHNGQIWANNSRAGPFARRTFTASP
jgi:hypothetical protein